MKVEINYCELTPPQKLRAFWNSFCDADPVPAEFEDEMQEAGLIFLREVTTHDLEDAFAAERGIENGGWVWDLTAAGISALAALSAAAREVHHG